LAAEHRRTAVPRLERNAIGTSIDPSTALRTLCVAELAHPSPKEYVFGQGAGEEPPVGRVVPVPAVKVDVQMTDYITERHVPENVELVTRGAVADGINRLAAHAGPGAAGGTMSPAYMPELDHSSSTIVICAIYGSPRL